MAKWVLLIISWRLASANLEQCLGHIFSLYSNISNCAYYQEPFADLGYNPSRYNTTFTLLEIADLAKSSVRFEAVLLSVRNSNLTYLKSLYSGCILPLRNDGVVIVVHFMKNLGDMFEVFWHCTIANVVVVTGESLEVTSYRPISEGNCSIGKAVHLGFCGEIASLQRETGFLYKGQCTVHILAALNRPYVDFGGFEVNKGTDITVLRLVTELLGLRVNFTCLHCDVLGQSSHKDLILRGERLNGYRTFADNELAYSQSQDEMAFFVPLSDPLEPWKLVFYIYDWPTWLALLLTTFALSLLVNLDPIYVISVLLQNTCSSKVVPRCFLLWNFASILLTSSYNSLLVSFMCKSIYKDQISSFAEIQSRGLNFGGNPRPIHFFRATFLAPNQQKLGTMCTIEGLDCYQRLVQGNFAYLTEFQILAYQTSLHKGHAWYMLKPIGKYYKVFSMTKGSPFYPKVQEYLTRIDESGMVKKDLYYTPQTQSSVSKYKTVTLQHLYFIFFVHAVCSTVAMGVFLMELVLDRKKRLSY